MTEPKPRRSKAPVAPETPSGYRQSRRGSKSAKAAKRALRQHAVASSVDRVTKGARQVVYGLAYGVVALIALVVVVLLAITTVNTFARWNAERLAARTPESQARSDKAKENVLVIGIDGDKASGFLALRVDATGKQVFGIAIPDAAFVDVPGQGFERIGEAYVAGPEVAMAAVSNYMTVPFETYLVIPKGVYADALKNQDVSAIVGAATASNLDQDGLDALEATINGIEQDNVALVPMPVKQLKLGDQTYFEPKREEIADLLKSWWGVDPGEEDTAVRVILYNGSGVPGIAGEAAQVLIRSGFRVVDTKNADNFNYKTTKIVVRAGEHSTGQGIRDALGVGEISVEPSAADVTDVVVIIGKDYEPPATTEQDGTQ